MNNTEETAKYVCISNSEMSESYHFPDITGLCSRNGDKIEASVIILVVEILSGSEVLYKERFSYFAACAFDLNVPDEVSIIAVDE